MAAWPSWADMAGSLHDVADVPRPDIPGVPFSPIRSTLPDLFREPECDAAGPGSRGRHAGPPSQILGSLRFRGWDSLQGNMECCPQKGESRCGRIHQALASGRPVSLVVGYGNIIPAQDP